MVGLLILDTMTWSECDTKGTPPTPCYGHSATAIEGDRILFYGGKGYAVHNSINVLEVSTFQTPSTKQFLAVKSIPNVLSIIYFLLETRTWKQYAFAGNPLCPRWGHCATVHSNGKEIVFFGGRDEKGYWGTYEHVDIGNELLGNLRRRFESVSRTFLFYQTSSTKFFLRMNLSEISM